MADHPNRSSQDLTNVDLGRYHVTNRIGSGGMGEVYEATDTLLKRKVALKRLLPRFASEENSRQRLLREARAVSALSHPNIAALYDLFQIDGETFLVMELIKGKPLDSAIEQPVTIETFLLVARQCAEALKAAHRNGIVHGDLKPSNVFLNDLGYVKVLDFGLARWLLSNSEATTASSPGLTGSSQAGTLLYLAPEVIRSRQSDQRRDLFALGLIFYELLTGDHPFRGDDVQATIARILGTTPPAPSTLNPNVPTGLDPIIAKLLEKDPAKRYANATELLKDLHSLEQDLRIPQIRGSPPGSRLLNRPLIRRIALATIIFCLVASGLLLFQRQRPTETRAFAERNWILLTDFENATGDPIFDQTLNEGLTLALQQSRHVNVYPRSQTFEALKRMARKNVDRIDESTGREICQRENLQVLVTGSIRRSGDNYQVTLRALEPINGTLLFAEREEFDKKEELFTKVDSLALRVRERLGEPDKRIEIHARPLAKVTTRSMKALQHYSQASDAHNRGETESARVQLLGALSLDPNFAMAHQLLAEVYELLGDPTKREEHFQRAYDLRHTLTDRERNMIEASYYADQGHMEKAVEMLKVLIGLYPDDLGGRKLLASCYRELGQLSKAIIELHHVIRLHPTDAHANGSLVILLARANNSKQAIEMYQKAKAVGVRTPELDWGLGLAYLGVGNLNEARRQFHFLEQSEGAYQVIGEIYNVRTTLYEGKFSETIHKLGAGIAKDQKSSNKQPEMLRRYLLANIFHLTGDSELVAEQLQPILSGKLIDLASDDIRRAGALFARIGKIDKAVALLNELQRRVKDAPTYFRKSCYFNLKGEISLAKDDPRDAIQSFLNADAELPWYVSHHGLARAYEESGDLKNASAEWQKVLDARGEILQDGFPPEWILAHLELARIQSRMNNREAARDNYQRFLQIWQQADAIPISEEATREWNQLIKEGGKNVLDQH